MQLTFKETFFGALTGLMAVTMTVPAVAASYGTVSETVVTEKDADGNVIKETVTKKTLTPAIVEDGEAVADAPMVQGLDEAEVNLVIEKWIRNNPEVIISVLQQHAQKMQAEEQQEQQQKALSVAADIYGNANVPFRGNPDASKMMVKFMDYRCGYCKRMVPAIDKLLEEDDDLKIYFLEIPILGPNSILATRASLAVWFAHPEKYGEFHDALYAASPNLDQSSIEAIILKSGLDKDEIIKGMNSEKVNAQISENQKIQQKAGISGTPFFIVGKDKVLPGAVGQAALENAIDEAEY